MLTKETKDEKEKEKEKGKKRTSDGIVGQISDQESLKRFRPNSFEPTRDDSSMMIPPYKKKEDDKMDLIQDPRIQTLITIVFSKMEAVNAKLVQEMRELTAKVAQIENKITGVVNKLRGLESKKNTEAKKVTKGDVILKRSSVGDNFAPWLYSEEALWKYLQGEDEEEEAVETKKPRGRRGRGKKSKEEEQEEEEEEGATKEDEEVLTTTTRQNQGKKK